MSHEHETSPAPKNQQNVPQPKGPEAEGAEVSDKTHLDKVFTKQGDQISPLLRELSRDLDQQLAALDVDHDAPEHRAQLVEALSQDLAVKSANISALLDQIPVKDRARYHVLVQGVSTRVAKVLRFIRTRSPHKDLEQRFMVAGMLFDDVLQKLGEPAIESLPAAVLTERATHSAELEARAVKAAAASLRTAIGELQKVNENALTTFFELAKLSDIKEPPFIETFLKALLMATLQELTKGMFEVTFKALVGHGHDEGVQILEKLFVEAPPEAMFEVAMEKGGEASEIGVGGEKKKGEKETPNAAPKVDQKLRALTYFKAGLANSMAHRFGAYQTRVTKMEADGSESAASLLQMEAAIRGSMNTVSQRQENSATKAWATYLAHARLGTHFAGNQKVSNMRDYFGQQDGSNRVFGTDRSHGDGVLSVLFVADSAGEAPHLEESATEVIGLNSELKKFILRDAHFEFSHVPLPKEVNVQVRFARATIALDETNRIRDVKNWEAIEPYVGESAYEYWRNHCRDLKVK